VVRAAHEDGAAQQGRIAGAVDQPLRRAWPHVPVAVPGERHQRGPHLGRRLEGGGGDQDRAGDGPVVLGRAVEDRSIHALTATAMPDQQHPRKVATRPLLAHPHRTVGPCLQVSTHQRRASLGPGIVVHGRGHDVHPVATQRHGQIALRGQSLLQIVEPRVGGKRLPAIRARPVGTGLRRAGVPAGGAVAVQEHNQGQRPRHIPHRAHDTPRDVDRPRAPRHRHVTQPVGATRGLVRAGAHRSVKGRLVQPRPRRPNNRDRRRRRARRARRTGLG
jgi:hypothetical protein